MDVTTEFRPTPDKDMDTKQTVAWCESGFKFAHKAREPYERVALQSMLFWAGQQWMHVIRDHARVFARRDISPDVTEGIRRVNNQMPIFTRGIISSMMGNLSDLEAIPATFDPDDVAAAQLSTRILKWRDRMDEEEAKRELELMWLFGCGEVLRRTFWDAGKGRPGLSEGDINTEVVSFFRYLKDPYSIDVWPPRFIIEYDARDVDWINSVYSLNGDNKVKPENVADLTRELDKLAYNIMTDKDATREPQKSSAILKRMYVPPSERYPEGHCWVWCDEKLLNEHDLQAAQFPYTRSTWFPIPGRLYPLSLIEMLVADQRSLNTLLSQLQDLTNKQLRNDIIHNGTGEAKQRIMDARTGRKEIILPPGTQKYDIFRYDSAMQNAQITMDRLITDLHEKAGQNKPSLGQPLDKQARVTELQIAREADFQSLSWHMKQFERNNLCPIATQKLVLAQAYYKNFRQLQNTNDEQAPEWFRGADLRNTTDVIAIPQPHLTPAMKRQAQVQAQEMGLLGPYQGAEHELSCRLTLRYMGLGEIEDEVARTYGTLEELQAYVGELDKLKKQAQIAQIAAMLQPPAPEQGMGGEQQAMAGAMAGGQGAIRA